MPNPTSVRFRFQKSIGNRADYSAHTMEVETTILDDVRCLEIIAGIALAKEDISEYAN